MVKINININNRSFILIGVLLLIIIAGGVVIAYNSNPANPSIMGHSLNEIDLPSCTDGQALIKQADGNWGCGSVSSGSVQQIIQTDNDAAQTLNQELERYHLTITSAFAGQTKAVDQTIITELCGDIDGCTVRLGMKGYLRAFGQETASIDALLYYGSDGSYRVAYNYGNLYYVKDGDGVIANIFSPWDTCILRDAESNSADNSLGLGLYMYNGNYYQAGMTCELTIID